MIQGIDNSTGVCHKTDGYSTSPEVEGLSLNVAQVLKEINCPPPAKALNGLEKI